MDANIIGSFEPWIRRTEKMAVYTTPSGGYYHEHVWKLLTCYGDHNTCFEPDEPECAQDEEVTRDEYQEYDLIDTCTGPRESDDSRSEDLLITEEYRLGDIFMMWSPASGEKAGGVRERFFGKRNEHDD